MRDLNNVFLNLMLLDCCFLGFLIAAQYSLLRNMYFYF